MLTLINTESGLPLKQENPLVHDVMVKAKVKVKVNTQVYA